MSFEGMAIRVSGVSKHYLLFARPEDRLKQMVVPRLERLAGRPPRRYYRDFAALSDVSFEIRRGETVGIVGRNGSGKSTLLQILCGTLRPSSGTVEVNGRIAALLELGAGFNPEFSGRDNVYMHGAILGLSRAEIDARFEAIARFADIGEFIEQPVKTYSSGMYVRLAFAAAINVDPDILVVDEALAVGDEAFQRKCYARLEDIKAKGCTILFVTHAMQTVVQLCDRAMLIDGGELILDGAPREVVRKYQTLIYAPSGTQEAIRKKIRERITASDDKNSETLPDAMNGAAFQTYGIYPHDRFDPQLISHTVTEYKANGAKISDISLVNSEGDSVNIITFGMQYEYQYMVEYFENLDNTGFGMAIVDTRGNHLFGQSSHPVGRGISAMKGDRMLISFPFKNLLGPGTYFCSAGVGKLTNDGFEYAHRIVEGFVFSVNVLGWDALCSSTVNLKIGDPVIKKILC
jgi:lipopolysaccharide transport system ATP-binding protein